MNDLLDDLFTDRTLTRPWGLDEYIVVDGRWRLVYDANKQSGITLVHLFGRRSTTLAELVAEGRAVTLPKRLRCC